MCTLRYLQFYDNYTITKSKHLIVTLYCIFPTLYHMKYVLSGIKEKAAVLLLS